MRGLSIIVVLLILSSCDTSKRLTPESKISDLEEILNNCTTSINEIDTLWMQQKIADNKQVSDEYQNLIKSLNDFNSLRSVLNVDLDFCKLQVSNLKSDLKNGFLTEEEFETNLAIEKRSVDDIYKKVELYKLGIEILKLKFDKLEENNL